MTDTRPNVYFIADIHLGAAYIADPAAHERRVVDWLMSIKHDARELYMLGDVLDYWFEYRTVVPRGHVRFFGALAALADAGVKITWLIGNHDIWLFDYLSREIGLTVADGIIDTTISGRRFILTHGDGIGQMKTSFRMMRALFRNPLCQKLYSAIHPRWTIPFALRWSNESRHFTGQVPQCHRPDTEPQIHWAESYASAHPDVDYLIMGHRHVMLDHPVGGHGARAIILGDWIHHFSYAVFDGHELKLTKIRD